MTKSKKTRNAHISTGTLADIFRRIYRLCLDAPRFHDQISAIAGQGFVQLKAAAEQFLAEVGNANNPAVDAATAYVAECKVQGALGDLAKVLFDRMVAYHKAVVPTDASLALLAAAFNASVAHELFWGPLFGLRSRVTNYWPDVLATAQETATLVVQKWCDSKGLSPDLNPKEPFYQGPLAIMRGYTLAELIRRGKRMDDDLDGLAGDVDAILTVSLDQLTELLKAGQATIAANTNLGAKIADYLVTPENERKLKVSGLTAAASDHLSGLGMDAVVVAILEASGRSWQLFRLFVQTDELYNRVRKFGDIEKYKDYPELYAIYDAWSKGEGADEVATFGTNPPPLPEGN
jgi:hypothetical protein